MANPNGRPRHKAILRITGASIVSIREMSRNSWTVLLSDGCAVLVLGPKRVANTISIEPDTFRGKKAKQVTP